MWKDAIFMMTSGIVMASAIGVIIVGSVVTANYLDKRRAACACKADCVECVAPCCKGAK